MRKKHRNERHSTRLFLLPQLISIHAYLRPFSRGGRAAYPCSWYATPLTDKQIYAYLNCRVQALFLRRSKKGQWCSPKIFPGYTVDLICYNMNCEAAELSGAAPEASSKPSAGRSEGLRSGRVRKADWDLPKFFNNMAMKTAIPLLLEVYSRDKKY